MTTVSVPAGQFEVWPVERTETVEVGSAANGFRIKEYISPSVGLAVKIEKTSRSRDGTPGPSATWEMSAVP